MAKGNLAFSQPPADRRGVGKMLNAHRNQTYRLKGAK